MVRTSAEPYCSAGRRAEFRPEPQSGVPDAGPPATAVSLEDEMLKVSANQMDYAAVTSLYSKSLHLLKSGDRQGLRCRINQKPYGE